MTFPLLSKRVQQAYDLRLPMSLMINFDGEGNYKLEIHKLGDKATTSVLQSEQLMKKILAILETANDEKEEK
ncbi:MAG: hypothetical protein HF309_18125 [Ignavibacteria bacterium]|nr:hypothetical protein [Ignavibacteria bacterium]